VSTDATARAKYATRSNENIMKKCKGGAGDHLPDGLHHRRGVEFLAAATGTEPDRIGAMEIFGEDLGFSEITGFIKSSDGRGYYRTTLTACTCPSFMFRGGLCKHQKKLAEALYKRGERLPANVELAIRRPEQLPYPTAPGARWEPNALAERKVRIDERNRQWRAAQVNDQKHSTTTKGFNLPEEVLV